METKLKIHLLLFKIMAKNLNKKQFMQLTLTEIFQFDIENKESMLIEILNEKGIYLHFSEQYPKRGKLSELVKKIIRQQI